MIRLECYFDEQIDDRFYVGIPPDVFYEKLICEWCEENIGERDIDWGLDGDEHYSYLSSGMMFWFTTDASRVLFRLRWAPLR